MAPKTEPAQHRNYKLQNSVYNVAFQEMRQLVADDEEYTEKLGPIVRTMPFWEATLYRDQHGKIIEENIERNAEQIIVLRANLQAHHKKIRELEKAKELAGQSGLTDEEKQQFEDIRKRNEQIWELVQEICKEQIDELVQQQPKQAEQPTPTAPSSSFYNPVRPHLRKLLETFVENEVLPPAGPDGWLSNEVCELLLNDHLEWIKVGKGWEKRIKEQKEEISARDERLAEWKAAKDNLYAKAHDLVKKKVAEKNEQIEELKSLHQEEVRKMRSKLEKQEEDLQNEQALVQDKEKQILDLTREFEAKVQRRDGWIEQQKEKARKVKEQLKQKDVAIQEKDRNIRDLEAKAKESADRGKAFAATKDKQFQDLTAEAKQQIEQVEFDNKTLNGEIDRLKKELKDMDDVKADLTYYKNDADELEEMYDAEVAQKQKFEAEVTELKGRCDELEEKVAGLEQNIQAKDKELEENLRELREASESTNADRVEIETLREKVQKLQTEKEDRIAKSAQEQQTTEQKLQTAQNELREAISAGERKRARIQELFEKLLHEALLPEDAHKWSHGDLTGGFRHDFMDPQEDPLNHFMPLEYFDPNEPQPRVGYNAEFCHIYHIEDQDNMLRPIWRSEFPGMLSSLLALCQGRMTDLHLSQDIYWMDNLVMDRVRPWNVACNRQSDVADVHTCYIRMFVVGALQAMSPVTHGLEWAHLSCLMVEILCFLVPPGEVIDHLIMLCHKHLQKSEELSLLGAAGVLRLLMCLNAPFVAKNYQVDEEQNVLRIADEVPPEDDPASTQPEQMQLELTAVEEMETEEMDAGQALFEKMDIAYDDDVDMEEAAGGPSSLQDLLPQFKDRRFKENIMQKDFCLLDMPSFLQEVCVGDIVGDDSEYSWAITNANDMVLVAEGDQQAAWLRCHNETEWIFTRAPLVIEKVDIGKSASISWAVGTQEPFQIEPLWDSAVRQYAQALGSEQWEQHLEAAAEERRADRQAQRRSMLSALL